MSKNKLVSKFKTLLVAVSFILVAILFNYNTASAALVINTNVTSIQAQRNLAATQKSLQESFERLSKGLRINSAEDDSTGLAIEIGNDTGEEDKSTVEEAASLQQFINSTAYLTKVLNVSNITEKQLQAILARVNGLADAGTASSQKNARTAVEKAIIQLNNLDKQLASAYALSKKSGFVPEIDDTRAFITAQRKIISTVIKSTSSFNRLAAKKVVAEKKNVVSLLNTQIDLYKITHEDLINFADEVRQFADDEVDYSRDF